MKLLLKYLLPVTLVIMLITSAAAQESKKDKIDALRVSFITKKVNFTDAESQKFWPLYNEMNDKQEAIRKTFRQKYNKNTNYDFSTDKEAEDYLNAELNLRQKEVELYKEYFEKYKKVVPLKKIAAVRRAEEEFKKEIIKTIKDN